MKHAILPSVAKLNPVPRVGEYSKPIL